MHPATPKVRDRERSGEFVVEREDAGLDEDLAEAARVTPCREEASAAWCATRHLFVHRRQDDEALLLSLDEAVQRLVLVLVVAHFLPDAGEVQADGRVADYHFEAQLAHLLQELGYRLRCRCISVHDRQRLLDLLRHLVEEGVCEAGPHDLAPVGLVGFAEDTLDGSFELL